MISAKRFQGISSCKILQLFAPRDLLSHNVLPAQKQTAARLPQQVVLLRMDYVWCIQKAMHSIRHRKVQESILDKLADKVNPVLAVKDSCSRKSSLRLYHDQ